MAWHAMQRRANGVSRPSPADALGAFDADAFEDGGTCDDRRPLLRAHTLRMIMASRPCRHPLITLLINLQWLTMSISSRILLL